MTTNKTMGDYIFEGHTRGLEMIEDRNELTKDIVELFLEKKPKSVWLIASGSSYNGVVSARNFMVNYLKIPVRVVPSATFYEYEYKELTEDDFAIVISQSGYSTNSISALEKINEMKYTSIGVTGNVDSDFKDYADLVVDYGVGVETVNWVTKGVTTNVLFFILFSLMASYKLEYINDKQYEEKVNEIREVLETYPKTIEDTNAWVEDNIKSLSATNIMYFCGYGSNYGTALEATLKFSETVHVPTIAYELEEYIHGNNLQLDPNYSVIIFDNGDHTQDKVNEIFEATCAITDRSYLITNRKYDDKRVLTLPLKDELLNPLVILPAVQTLAFRISDMLDRKQHPLLKEFNKIAKSKSDNLKEE